MSAGVLRGHKRAWFPLEQELQMVMSRPNWGPLQVLLTAESSSLTHKEVFMPVLRMLSQGQPGIHHGIPSSWASYLGFAFLFFPPFCFLEAGLCYVAMDYLLCVAILLPQPAGCWDITMIHSALDFSKQNFTWEYSLCLNLRSFCFLQVL